MADDGFERAADAADVVVWGSSREGSSYERTGLGWAELEAASAGLARHLVREGALEGDVVVVSGATRLETLLVLFAAWQCGLSVSLVPAADRRPDEVIAGDIDRRVGQLGARIVYAESSVWEHLRPHPGLACIALDERTVTAPSLPDPPHAGRSDDVERPFECLRTGLSGDLVALHQATSGTTGDQRIVPVTWRMLRLNVAAMAERLELDRRDSFVSWMPLYHDMGLITYVVTPALLGARMAVLPAEAFALSPTVLAEEIERRRGTMSGSPTSGVALFVRALERYGPFDLSSLRRLVCGAEMIDLELCERAIAAGQRHGLRADAFSYAYGMAEATLAVSVHPFASPMEVEDPVDDSGANPFPSTWLRATGRGFARTGPPVDGTAVRVVDVSSRQPCGDRELGEIEIRGPSVMTAYVGLTPAESGVGDDGWFRTGDLGYLSEGEVVVAGRIKDVVAVGGRNIVPDDVERIVGSLDGIRRGRVAAVPMLGRAGEALAVVAERTDEADVDERAVRVAVRRELGITPEIVRLVPKGTLPKTTSGKLRRVACRDLVAGDAGDAGDPAPSTTGRGAPTRVI